MYEEKILNFILIGETFIGCKNVMKKTGINTLFFI